MYAVAEKQKIFSLSIYKHKRNSKNRPDFHASVQLPFVTEQEPLAKAIRQLQLENETDFLLLKTSKTGKSVALRFDEIDRITVQPYRKETNGFRFQIEDEIQFYDWVEQFSQEEK